MNIFLLLFFVYHLANSRWTSETENIEFPDLFEGDIILDPDERPINGTLKFAAVVGKRWPNPVPWEFGKDMKRQRSGKRVILEAMAQYEKYTCIRFKPRTNEKGYMRFDWAPGCASSVGFKSGKVNKINLDSPCWHLGTVMHEMGHSLGLWHEQSRPDRDQYIKIMWDNIKEEHKHNFEKHSSQEIDDLGTPYALDSMMHYGTTEFSKDGSRTIRTLDYSKRLLLGKRDGFANKDVQVLNLMYKCPAFKGTVPPKVCKDTGEKNCAYEKKRGRCRDVSYETRMYQVCCKTCFGNVAGKLGEPKTWPHEIVRPTTSLPTLPPGGCKDKASKSQCSYWERMGYCTSKSATIRKMALDSCCATCKAHH